MFSARYHANGEYAAKFVATDAGKAGLLALFEARGAEVVDVATTPCPVLRRDTHVFEVVAREPLGDALLVFQKLFLLRDRRNPRIKQVLKGVLATLEEEGCVVVAADIKTGHLAIKVTLDVYAPFDHALPRFDPTTHTEISPWRPKTVYDDANALEKLFHETPGLRPWFRDHFAQEMMTLRTPIPDEHRYSILDWIVKNSCPSTEFHLCAVRAKRSLIVCTAPSACTESGPAGV